MVASKPALAATLALAAAAFLRPGLALVAGQFPAKASTFRQPRGNSSARYTLNDGRTMPRIGFGTYRIPPGNETYASVSWALRTGYRMFDTARLYGNEVHVGRAIRDSGVPREEVFVTTKLWMDQHGYQKALKGGLEANKNLDLGYIDLLLIHSPYGAAIVETYDAMLELRRTGVVRSVGVSNFGVQHLKAIENYCRPAPVVNQFELHPLNINARRDIVSYCKEHNILVQPYGSVLSGHEDLLNLADRTAKKHGKTEAQVMLRWALDHGFGVIPKSVHRDRIEENFDVFDFALSRDEVKAMSSFKGVLKGEYWQPTTFPAYVGNVQTNCTKKKP